MSAKRPYLRLVCGQGALGVMGLRYQKAVARVREADWQRIIQQEKDGCLPCAPEGTADSKPAVWGLGGAPSVQPLADLEHDWFWPDTHGKYVERGLWVASLNALREQQPHRLILGGDWLDLHEISRWNAAQRKRMMWHEVNAAIEPERDFGRRMLDEIRSVYLGEIRFTGGNHDYDRLVEWLPDGELWDWLGMTQAGVICHNRAGFYVRPEHLVLHGNFAGKTATKAHWQHFGGSGWHGHKHEYQVCSAVYPDGRQDEWTGSPAMCRLDVDYLPGGAGVAKWHQGWLAGVFDRVRCVGTDVARWDASMQRLVLRGEVYR